MDADPPPLDDARGKRRLTGILLVLAAVVTWGAYFPLAKIVLLKLSPEAFLIMRLGVGALALYLLNLVLRKPLGFAPRDWFYVLGAGAVGIILHQLIQLNGLKSTSATNIGWILTLIPPVTGILGWVWLKERVAPIKILGLLIAMLGVVILVSKGDLRSLSFGVHRGDMLGLVSVGTWSVYTVMLKSRLVRYEPLAIAAVHMLLGFVFFSLVGAGDLISQASSLSGVEWAIVILIGVIPSGLAYYWWAAGLKRLAAIDTAMFLFIEAIVASMVGWMVLGEIFRPVMVFAAVIIIVGVIVAEHRWVAKREE